MLWEAHEWSREAERFPVGTYVRIHADHMELGRKIARVTESAGRRVTVRINHTHGTAYTFDADWLFPVRYVSVRYFGPGMSPRRSEFLGSRYVASGIRGDRKQYTRKADHTLRPEENSESAALDYARDRLGMCNPSAEHWQDRNTGAHVYALTDYGRCECSPDDYGPCEWHGENIVTREGSSVRAADDLGHTFLTDVASVLSAWPSPEFERDTVRIGNALADNGGSWLPDPEDTDGADLREWLQDLIREGESALGDAGYSVWWDDGYRIVRITGGPLAR